MKSLRKAATIWRLALMVVATALLTIVFLSLPGRTSHKLAVVRNLPARFFGRFFPPKGGHLAGLSPEEREAIRRLAARLDATIVWSSNREGSHHIYLIDLRSQTLQRLTNDPHVDGHPSFSPDGTEVAFMRGQRPWVSLREERLWDLFVVNSDGTGERFVSHDAFAPYWSPDGQFVIFSRGDQVVRVNPVTNREETLLDADRAIPGGHIAGGNLSPDGRQLTFSIRGVFDGVAIYDLGEHRLIPVDKNACDIVWAPDGSLVWIEVGGNGDTRVMTNRQRKISVFMDLPGAYSHEYFPKPSNDGRWLVWGASAGGHEHDRADYELFVWEIGTPWDQATRLTYNPSNDNYPDLHVRSTTERIRG